jgi:hypothetical protein
VPSPQSGEIPKESECGMMRPIRVKPKGRYEKLDPLSRVNFGKIYTFEHNVKAYDFGDVHEDFIGTLKHQWDYVLKADLAQELEYDSGDYPIDGVQNSSSTKEIGKEEECDREKDEEGEDDFATQNVTKTTIDFDMPAAAGACFIQASSPKPTTSSYVDGAPPILSSEQILAKAIDEKDKCIPELQRLLQETLAFSAEGTKHTSAGKDVISKLSDTHTSICD